MARSASLPTFAKTSVFLLLVQLSFSLGLSVPIPESVLEAPAPIPILDISPPDPNGGNKDKNNSNDNKLTKEAAISPGLDIDVPNDLVVKDFDSDLNFLSNSRSNADAKSSSSSQPDQNVPVNANAKPKSSFDPDLSLDPDAKSKSKSDFDLDLSSDLNASALGFVALTESHSDEEPQTQELQQQHQQQTDAETEQTEQTDQTQDSSSPSTTPSSTSSPARFDVPLERQRVAVESDDGVLSYKSVYFGHIAIGYPVAQQFSVVFDTGSGHVIVPSSSCRRQTCQVHRRYNRTASGTAVDVDANGDKVVPGAARDQLTVAFGTGEVTGQFVADRVCLGMLEEGPACNASCATSKLDACSDMRIITASAMSHEPFYAFAFDGIVGLGLDALALSPEFSFFGMLSEQHSLQDASFGVFLADHEEEISELSFGGHSPARVSGSLQWAPVVYPEEGHWMVQVVRLRLGDTVLDYCEDGECRAVVDTGTSLLVVPTGIADELEESLEEALEDPIGLGGELPVDCRDARGLPLHFDLAGGMTITLLPGDYARPSVRVEEDETVEEEPTATATGPIDNATLLGQLEGNTSRQAASSPPSSYSSSEMLMMEFDSTFGTPTSGTFEKLESPGKSSEGCSGGSSELYSAALNSDFDSTRNCSSCDIDGNGSNNSSSSSNSTSSTAAAPGTHDSNSNSASGTTDDESTVDGLLLNKCRPTLMPIELPEPLGPKLFIWGEPVLRKYYTVYHWEEQKVGFGLAVHTPPSKAATQKSPHQLNQ